jgi:hypothetical protein
MDLPTNGVPFGASGIVNRRMRSIVSFDVLVRTFISPVGNPGAEGSSPIKTTDIRSSLEG